MWAEFVIHKNSVATIQWEELKICKSILEIFIEISK